MEINNFYPRSPCGERRLLCYMILACLYFYPRSPCGERLSIHFVHLRKNIFLSTLSLRRATNNVLPAYAACGISIHALLAESDICASCTGTATLPISIHALLAESDVDGSKSSIEEISISIHALLAESDLFRGDQGHISGDISIHALLAESDAAFKIPFPTSEISIHALLAESDKPPLIVSANPPYFYPRSPCGERHRRPGTTQWAYYFYPRSPCGERHTAIVVHLLL